jgi:hypothetical protein
MRPCKICGKPVKAARVTCSRECFLQLPRGREGSCIPVKAPAQPVREKYCVQHKGGLVLRCKRHLESTCEYREANGKPCCFDAPGPAGERSYYTSSLAGAATMLTYLNRGR